MTKDDVLKHFGGVTKTARALGIRAASVSAWREQIPLGRAYQIQAITNGALKVSDTATTQEPQDLKDQRLGAWE